MTFNPDIHHRRSIRLRHYDYATAGAYFVTICTGRRECLLDEVDSGEVRLNAFGNVVNDCWQAITNHFPAVELDEYVIMPNHFHGILFIVGAGSPRPDCDCPVNIRGEETPPLRQATLGQIVGYFKYQSTKQINLLRDSPGMPIWQRNYYERVIRDDHELERAREYIVNNPLCWDDDENNLR